MKMKFLSFTFLLLLVVFQLFLISATEAQNSSFLPLNLGPSVNSEYAEVNPVLSEDGKTLFFNRLNHPENEYGSDNSQDIWYSYLQPDGTWSKAKKLDAAFNKNRHNAIFCSIGKETYLIDGIYSKGNKTRWIKRGISVVSRNENDQWSKPERVKIKAFRRLNDGLRHNVWMTADRKAIIYSFSRNQNGKKNNLYVSTYKEGRWTRPRKIGKAINRRSTSEEAPFVSADSEIMYFTSNRGADGKKDKFNYNIFKTSRIDESWRKWSTPVRLSDTINSVQWDSYFKTNPKGSIAHFSSTKNSLGQSDIFRIKLFEENPFVVIKGNIRIRSTNEVLAGKKDFRILTDSIKTDSFLTINRDSSTYTLKLPLGKSYKIRAELKNYKSYTDTVDVREKKEFTTVSRDLYVEPIPYVHISGHLLVMNPRGIIPSSTSPKIVVNGKIADTVRVEYPEGKYEMLLPYGNVYTLSVQARKFNPEPVKIDLSHVKEYQEIKKDLFVKAHAVATVSGTFFLKGTTQKISSVYNPKLTINGEIVDSALIDTAASTYRITLPLKKSYTLSFVATKYAGIPAALDLTNTTEPTDLKKDLYGTYISSTAVVSGKVINRKTNKPLLNAENLKIQVNSQDYPAASYSAATGEYTMELGLGQNYTINGALPKFFPQYEALDLSKEKGAVKVIRDLYVTPIEVGQNVKLNNIFFESGKSTLKPKSYTELNKVVDFMNNNTHLKIQIEGHTDNVGKPDANLKLSRWRARAVQQYLVTKGIDISRISFEGYGSAKPVTKNTTAQGRSMNRRVEFKILSID